MKRKNLFSFSYPVITAFVITVLFSCRAFAQPFSFVKMYNKGNIGYAVREVPGNNYVVAGGTDFYMNWHWFIMSSLLNTNVHFFKTDNFGNLIWEKIYSKANSRSIANWVEPTQDGGFILTGFGNRDQIWPPDSNDVLLIKTDANGTISWSKYYDSGKDDLGYCVRQTSDGGYIVSGFHDAVPVSPVGNTYALLIKTDANGAIQWEKKYQFAVRDLATGEPFCFIVRQTADGGYVITGTTASTHAADVYVIRTDVNGNLLWAKSYDHDLTALRFSRGLDIIESASGDFIIAGSMDKDRPTMKYNYPYILKISSNGAFIDANFYETVPVLPFQSGFSSVEQTTDGGFFFTGMGGYSGFGDQAQLLKTDVNFNVQWSRVYTNDGIATVGSRCGRQTTDGGYVFTGKRQMAGTIMMKTDENGLIPCKTPGFLVEYVPGIETHSWAPLTSAAVSMNILLLTTLNPLIDTSTLCPSFTLPVELSLFTASARNNSEVHVQWTTASEINNDYFIVEKSTDGINFNEAGRIKGAGNSTNLLNYSFIDEHPSLEKLSYYRLKQVDYNGASDFSGIVPVRFMKDNFELLNVIADHQNKSIKIYIATSSSEHIQYKLSDLFGKLILQGSQSSTGEFTELIFDGINLPNGVYFLAVDNGENILTRKIFY